MTSTPVPAQGAETPEAADPTGPATGAPAQAVEITEASEALSGGELLSRTAVIVVSYDSAALLERTLARVAEDSPEARIIVVDNYSTPAAREELVALASSRGWEAVLPETNTGFGGGMNLGAARARELGADLLVLLNPDAVIARADLIRLAARAHADRLALVAPVLKDSSGRIVSDGIVVCLADGSMRSRRSPRPIPPGGTQPWLSGACLALSADLFEAAGGLDARYFLYWEDVDFSARVLAAGGSLALVRDAVASTMRAVPIPRTTSPTAPSRTSTTTTTCATGCCTRGCTWIGPRSAGGWPRRAGPPARSSCAAAGASS